MSKIKFAISAVLMGSMVSTVVFAAPYNATTVGIYDSTDQTNAVDRTANGNLATFKTEVAAAFAADLGGVINFNTLGNAFEDINATYGAGGGKILAIDTSRTFNNQVSPNIHGISGNTQLHPTGLFSLDPTFGAQTSRYTFGTITGGLPNEAVTQAGLTILARNGGGTPTIKVTANFSDNTSTFATQSFTSTSSIPNGVEDTFFGFTAPVGASILNIELDYGSSGTDLRRGVDDFAFITSVVPEPASLGMLALGGLGALRRRRGR